jgi:cytoskeletal protein RodZ
MVTGDDTPVDELKWWHLIAAVLIGGGVGALVTYLVVQGRGGRSTEPTDTADELEQETNDKIDADKDPTDDDLKSDLEDLA